MSVDIVKLASSAGTLWFDQNSLPICPIEYNPARDLIVLVDFDRDNELTFPRSAVVKAFIVSMRGQ